MLPSGPRFNIKMSSYQYSKSHCEDQTVVRSSYLHNGVSYTGKWTSLYWFVEINGDKDCYHIIAVNIDTVLHFTGHWICVVYEWHIWLYNLLTSKHISLQQYFDCLVYNYIWYTFEKYKPIYIHHLFARNVQPFAWHIPTPFKQSNNLCFNVA